jgi:hypothetical protein
MIARDFVTRTLQQLSHMLAALFGGASGRQLAETMARLDVISATFTGLDLATLRRLPYDDVRAVLSAGGALAVERAYAAARVLHADAEFAAGRGAGASVPQGVTALRLLAEATVALGGFVDPEHEAAMLALHDAVKEELAGATAALVFEAFRIAARFDRAEDVLFAWLAREAEATGPDATEAAAGRTGAAAATTDADLRANVPGARAVASDFYETLMALPDEALERGRLPRREVLEAMRELGLPPPGGLQT